ncbi:MAG: hypothetical protein NTY04_03895 [Candidatus Staskawiczbacteria bacterium]|nr:hypothetical protein [Candidatus Staskawiczbacteria bacterium]
MKIFIGFLGFWIGVFAVMYAVKLVEDFVPIAVAMVGTIVLVSGVYIFAKAINKKPAEYAGS